MRLSYAVRLLMSLTFVSLTWFFSFGLLMWIGLLHLALSLTWVVLLEANVWGLGQRLGGSHWRILLDVLALTLFVHITGNTFSFVVMGYVVVTALSSVREDNRTGLFAILYSVIAYTLMTVANGLGWVAPTSIVGPPHAPGRTAMIMAPLVLAAFCLLVNRVVYTLYHKADELRRAAENDREVAELSVVMAEKLRLELEGYADFARHLNLAESLSEMLHRVFAFLASNFHAETSLLLLAHPSSGTLSCRGARLPAEQASDTATEVRAYLDSLIFDANSFFFRALSAREPLSVDLTATEHPDVLNLLKKLAADHLLAVPLFVQDEAFALLCVLDPATVARDERDRRSLRSFCEQVTGSLKSAILRDEAEELRARAEAARAQAERAAREMSTLSDFTRQINSEGNLDIILNRIFDFIESYYGLDGIWLQFIDEEAAELYTYKTTRPHTLTDEQVNFIRGMRVPLEKGLGIATYVYHRKRPYYMARRPSKITPHDREVADFLGIQACLYVPLLIHGEAKAMISFTNFETPMRLSREDIRALKWFCDQIAGAINNSRLHTESEFSRMIAEQRLDEVRRLKFQQDTDYFLTSNLIRPLERISVESETISVDSLTRQKVSFPHLRWHCEIGGDYTQAASVELKGRRYTVFINADAMGKSIQGAGGVLVLGSVFSIIVDRTPTTRYQYPEQWLKNTYLELDKIFRTFDGSMYISLVMGLVDDASGAVYFINAEHPYPVLFRDGRAQFVTPRYKARKLGFLLGRDRISVDYLRLQDGDVLICGSDGRDDILLRTRTPHGAEMNSDDNLFLMHVEQAGGDLQATYEAICRTGTLSDDISLLRLVYTRVDAHPIPSLEADGALDLSARAHELLKKNRPREAIDLLMGPSRMILSAGICGEELDFCFSLVITALLQAYTIAGEYGSGRAIAEEYLSINPQSRRLIHYLSLCSRFMGDLEYAADCGERVLLRDPEDEAAIVNLAEIYLELDNRERSRMLLQDLAELEPGHEALSRLGPEVRR